MFKWSTIYNQELLEKDVKANLGRAYQKCTISVMDTISDPNIQFDEDGICNYYHEYKKQENEQVLKGEEGAIKLNEIKTKLKDNNKHSKYDCILGLSGGVDSTYLCLLAKQLGLNPLVVHCDNGWNSELAQENIENTVKTCGFDLFTYVINWEHFKELQLSYLKSSVVDIEVLTDHAFMAVLYQQARKFKINYVLAGMNIVTEQVLPKYWIYSKADLSNIKDIQLKFGRVPFKKLDSFPSLNDKTKRYFDKILKMEVVAPLNYVQYNYDEVKALIIKELNWRDYGGKHFESIWTRFYQGYILPRKFNIDKRKAHFSNLIFSGQLSRDEAMLKLKESPYSSIELLQEDYEYVLKKFGLNTEDFENIMNLPRREHNEFKTMKGFWEEYPSLKFLRPILNVFRG